jgi:hypothetical protein
MARKKKHGGEKTASIAATSHRAPSRPQHAIKRVVWTPQLRAISDECVRRLEIAIAINAEAKRRSRG